MTLGETLKLGYLECAPRREQSPMRQSAHHAVVNKIEESCGSTLKLNETEAKSITSGGYIKDEAPIQPLEWTHPPVREVRRDGNMRYQVSKAAVPSKRENKHHLVRTTRLDPQPASRPSSRSSSRRPSSRPPPMKSSEEIVVTEADFRRCGKRLNLLRQCQLEKLPGKSQEQVKNEMELSFKSAFRKRCQSQDDPLVDPWKDCGNPEETRQAYEGDLILNQVWVDSDKRTREESEEESSTPLASARCRSSRRATSAGTATRHPNGCTTETPALLSHSARDRQETYAQSRKRSRRPESHRRARSQGAIPTEGNAELTICPFAPLDSSRQSRRHRTSHASGCPKPGCDPSAKIDTREYESRIQLIDDAEEQDVHEYVGSLAVQQAARMQRRFEHKLNAESVENSKPQALWLSLDALTGEVYVYSRAASTRLEAAHVNNRSNVPLAGLGGMFEDAIVHLGLKGSDEHPVQKSLEGGQMDVRRLTVRPDTKQISINVFWDHGWRIADAPLPGPVPKNYSLESKIADKLWTMPMPESAAKGTTEERHVLLSGTETVRPPSPPLPRLNPDRRAITATTRPWWEDVETW